MLSFECIKNEKSVYFLLTSASCERNLSEIGQLRRGEEAGCLKSSTREAI